jgi:hypothetical protein
VSGEVDTSVLDEAVLKHQALPVHGHEYASSAADLLFVEYGELLRLLDSSEWQIIFGGPGAGKTHLLRAFCERTSRGALQMRAAGDRIRSVPVYIDAQQITGVRRRDSDEDQAEAYFTHFLELFGQELISAVTRFDSKQSLYARLRDEPTAAGASARITREILAEVEHAPSLPPYREHDIEVDVTEEDESSRDNVFDIFGNLELPRGPSGGIRGEAKRGRRSSRRERRSVSKAGRAEPRWPRIRQLVEDLCNELAIERIDIVIDNWTALDPAGTSLVQPYFADLLKHSFYGCSTISLKLGADGLATRLWDDELACGLHPENEITELANLGHALLSNEALVDLFEQILYRRMLKNCQALRAFTDPHDPQNSLSGAFTESLFEDRTTFELLVLGTEGRPRLFLRCLRAIAHEADFRVDPKWHRELVLGIIQTRARLEIDDIRTHSPAVKFLLTEVKPSVVEKNNPLFVLRRRTVEGRAEQLRELISKNLIRGVTKAEARATTELIPFRVSQDLMKEWERARRFEQWFQEATSGAPWVEEGGPDLEDLIVDPDDEPDAPGT